MIETSSLRHFKVQIQGCYLNLGGDTKDVRPGVMDPSDTTGKPWASGHQELWRPPAAKVHLCLTTWSEMVTIHFNQV